MIRLALLSGVACLLCACQTTAPKAPKVALPAAFEAPAASATLTPAQLDRWWLLFNDPQLNALEDEAFRYSPDARTAEARVIEAKATRDSQTAQTFPTGNLAGNATHQVAYNVGSATDSLFPIGGVTDTQTANFNVSWELDLFGRLAQARRIANADLTEALFDIEGTRASLAASVADNYFQARGYAIQLQDARETARIQTELERVATRKANLGLGASSDADRVAGDLSQAQAQVETLEAQMHVAQRQLLILVGRAVDPTASLPLDAEVEDPPATPAAVPGDLLARRPDIRESEARLRVQIGTGRLRHLAIFPTFTLLPGLGLSRTTEPGVGFIPPATLIPQEQTTSLGLWSLGVGVNVPVLDIPQLLADAKAEDARTKQAAIAYEKTVQTAFGEAESALVSLGADERAATLLKDGEVRAHRASKSAARRYAMGLDDITAALSAEQSWRTTRSALTAERVQALRQAVQTYKALGGGWAYAALSSRTR